MYTEVKMIFSVGLMERNISGIYHPYPENTLVINKEEITMEERNIVAEYDYYTLDQAREIILKEMRHKRLVRKWKAAQETEGKRQRLALIYQRCAGLYLAALGIALPFLCGDGTFSLLAIPFGIYVATRKEILL